MTSTDPGASVLTVNTLTKRDGPAIPEDADASAHSPILPYDGEDSDSAQPTALLRTKGETIGLAAPQTATVLPPNSNAPTPVQDQDVVMGNPLAPGAHSSLASPTRKQHSFPVPEPLRRHTSNFVQFNDIPTLPAFLENCNLSQYLQSFIDAGATEDALPQMLEFDDGDLKELTGSVSMKPFHELLFKRGIKDLRERSRMGSMHFESSQGSFMHPNPPSRLELSASQLFSQHPPAPPPPSLSQPSQVSQNSQHSQSNSQSLSQRVRHYPPLYRQPSSQPNTSMLPPSQNASQSNNSGRSELPTPADVLAGRYHQSGAGDRAAESDRAAQRYNSVRYDAQPSLKRRKTESPPPQNGATSPNLDDHTSMSPVSTSSWSSMAQSASLEYSHSQGTEPLTREAIRQHAIIYGNGKRKATRPLTDYEAAMNTAAQDLAMENPALLSNKMTLMEKAKAKLLSEGFRYARGKSRSKLPEAAASHRKDDKMTKERIMARRGANASRTASARLQKIADLGEELHRKNAEREELLAKLLRLERLPNSGATDESTHQDIRVTRERLAEVQEERLAVSKELCSLKNKERKHQWYEKRKKPKVDETTDNETGAEGDVEELGAPSSSDVQRVPQDDAESKSQGHVVAIIAQPSTPSSQNIPLSQSAKSESGEAKQPGTPSSSQTPLSQTPSSKGDGGNAGRVKDSKTTKPLQWRNQDASSAAFQPKTASQRKKKPLSQQSQPSSQQSGDQQHSQSQQKDIFRPFNA
ncbi:hypothetical protein DFQ26_001662 [Actinomortierella ambigua]|nr:hypothetical protein DFQ26_001662 [Actinomortierella ambigua]